MYKIAPIPGMLYPLECLVFAEILTIIYLLSGFPQIDNNITLLTTHSISSTQLNASI
jgi:hypothetical protein